MTQNYVTVSIKLCLDVWNDEYTILCKFISYKLQTKVFYLATTALVPLTINTGEEPERVKINK